MGLIVVILGGCASPEDSVDRATVGNETNRTDLSGSTTEYTTGSVDFVGYGPGKSHNGTFTNWTATISKKNSTITGGRVTIDMNSLKTEISGLTTHLKGEDFFHVNQYPRSTFTATIRNGSSTGSLTMHGQTREITFPVNVSEHVLEADFAVDLSRFDVTHPAANDVARVTFNISR